METYPQSLLTKLRSSQVLPVFDRWLGVLLFTSVYPPVAWSRAQVEHDLATAIPDELAVLWTHCSRLVLFEDRVFGQWGVQLCSPVEIVVQQAHYRKVRTQDSIFIGDVCLGAFKGDLDLVILRCDPHSDDFGHVLVSPELGSRNEWPTAAGSLFAFLDQLLQVNGDKYWEAP
jgi:hypothetical protein